MRLIRYIYLLTIIILITPNIYPLTELVFIGRNIPKRIPINSSGIYYNSDSLFVNGQKLKQNVDYQINKSRQEIVLLNNTFSETDTLVLIFNPLPKWLKKSYGLGLPEIANSPVENIYLELSNNDNINTSDESNISFSGAKTFRVNSNGVANSAFSQSLDLNISGYLTDNIEINGVVSDRGYNSSYGTLNSRINELDKINLNLKSNSLSIDIGDIFAGRKDRFGSLSDQRVSGISFRLNYPKWNINGTAARPKGRFESVKFFGEDNNQGPYQVNQSNRFRSIVPSSETVWLNGQKLQRGADKDYIIDYPTGWITFNVNNPIDRRSRIEIDFEPYLNDYRKELFKSGGGIVFGDSTMVLNFGWIRDGDKKEDFLDGNLSEDDKAILSSVGDSTELAFKSGAVLDSTGNYILAVDSLGNEFYQYIGSHNGDYNVRFSFVGQGKGDYRFLGSDNYLYMGEFQGDYLPIINISAPERTEYFVGEVVLNMGNAGEIEGEFQKSKLDRNLLSPIDDDDNSSDYYDFSWQKSWGDENKSNFIRTRRMFRGKGFHDLIRLNRNDQSYLYLLPQNFQADTKQEINEFESDLSLSKTIKVSPYYSNLKFTEFVDSKRFGSGISIRLSNKLSLNNSYRKIETELIDQTTSIGNGKNYSFGIDYEIADKKYISTYWENDKRTNDFSVSERGTKYDKLKFEINRNSENISYEFFEEDSLIGAWVNILKRHRITAKSENKFGQFDYKALVSFQNIESTNFNDNSILSRFKLSYRNQRKNLNIRTSYLLSDETKNSRGITFLEVSKGEGDYIFEDSVYVPDDNGDFIRIEEILSEKAKVKKGERSFSITKNWSQLDFRFDSRLNEELLDSSKRKWWWIIPFLPSETGQLFFMNRRYNSNINLFPIKGGHRINLSIDESAEYRTVANIIRKRTDRNFGITLKQVYQSSFFEESLELFNNDRDIYFNNGGKINGFKSAFKYRLRNGNTELSAKTSYQKSKNNSSIKSNIISLELGSRWQFIKQGDLRSTIEFYHQTSLNRFQIKDFLLTGNRPGKKGIIWSISTRQDLKKKMRLNLAVSGRHSDIRTARITGRGEIIAEF